MAGSSKHSINTDNCAYQRFWEGSSSHSNTSLILLLTGCVFKPYSCSIARSCPTLHSLMNFSMSGFPVFYHLLEFAQTNFHWISDAIQPSHSVIPFSSCLQSFPASGSFPMSWLFTSGGQRIGASASASVLPMNIQGWFPLGLTGLISMPYRK